MRLKLVPSQTNWDFFRFAKVTFGASLVAVVISVALFLVVGLNFGIDFRGGTTIRTESPIVVDVGAYRDAMTPLELGDISITEVFDPTFGPDQNVAMVRIQAQEGDESVSVETVLAVEKALAAMLGGEMYVANGLSLDDATAFLPQVQNLVPGATVAEGVDGVRYVLDATVGAPLWTELRDLVGSQPTSGTVSVSFENISFPSVESVGPKVSGELVQTAIIAVVLAIAAVLFYIWLRFEWQFSLGAVAALIHDVILTIGIFSLFQIQFDLAIIAALLTIVGYSLNDTVVVFDRVRENLIKYKKRPLQEVLNLSINETLSRTVMTSGTTLLALIALLVLGGDVIRGFVFAMTWGIVIGTYSSVFVASNVLLMLGTKRDWSKPDASAGTQFAGTDP